MPSISDTSLSWLNIASNWIAYPPAAMLLMWATRNEPLAWIKYCYPIMVLMFQVPFASTLWHICYSTTTDFCFSKNMEAMYINDLQSALAGNIAMVAMYIPNHNESIFVWLYTIVAYAVMWTVTEMASAYDLASAIFLAINMFIQLDLLWPYMCVSYHVLGMNVLVWLFAAGSGICKIYQETDQLYDTLHPIWHVLSGISAIISMYMYVYISRSEKFNDQLLEYNRRSRRRNPIINQIEVRKIKPT